MKSALYKDDEMNIELNIDEGINRFGNEGLVKVAQKGFLTCAFCNEQLRVRAGKIREVHFAHLKGESCQESKAYYTYFNQTKRENEKHSVIKEIVYNELKTQEVIKPDLKIEYGYKEKTKSNWKYYPDIYMKKSGKEFAISVITNVNEIGDSAVAKSIKTRNQYFKGKGLESIWLIEDRELALDFENRIIHLWESEYDLAIKTSEDHIWDEILNDLVDEFPDYDIFEVFGYIDITSH